MNIADIKKLSLSDCASFSEIAKDQLPMPGAKKRLDEILNKQIILTDCRIRDSKKREGTKCLQVQFAMDGDVFVFFSGSAVLADQIQAVKEHFPISATVVKIDKYYSFS